MRPLKHDLMFLDMATVISRQSYSIRLKVGAIIAERDKLGNVVAFGWNGMPSGEINACEVHSNGEIITEEQFLNDHNMKTGDLKSRDGVIHAEENALRKLTLGKTKSNTDYVMYVTHEPCTNCAKRIVDSGAVSKVIYRHTYSPDPQSSSYGKPSGTQYMEERGIEVVQLT